MHTNELMDVWNASGSDYNVFRETLESLVQNTYVTSFKTDALTLLHYMGDSPTDPDKLNFAIHSAQQIAERKNLLTCLSANGLKDSGLDDDFLKELREGSKLMLRMNRNGAQREDFYFTSQHLCRDIAARASVGGDAIYDPTNERDIYLMSRYVKQPVEATAVIRRNGSDGNVIHKVFALPSSTYCHIEQDILLHMADKLAEELGPFQCDHWYIDHFITQVWLTFPSHAQDVCDTYGLPDTFVPGVLLETSDTGDCSVRAIAFWQRTGFSRARIGMFEREHRGNFDKREILANYQKKLMGRYLELPQRLAELMTVDIPDTSAAIEAILKQLHANKELGKKRAKSLLEAMQAEVASRPSMTAYELALLFMELPARIITDKVSMETIENYAGKVPFMDFNKIAKATSTVILT